MPEKNLEIKKSQLPGSGKGLFTKTAIAKGSIIVQYTGRITTWKKIHENKIFNAYVYYVNRNHVIDAKPYKKSFARYANDARGLVKMPGVRNNSHYISRQKKIFIQATKDIAAGEEILVGYGKEYWDVIRHNNKIELKKKTKAATGKD